MARCFLICVAKMFWTIWWAVNGLGRTVCSQDSVLLAWKTRKCICCHVVGIHNAGAALQHYVLFNQCHDQCWQGSRNKKERNKMQTSTLEMQQKTLNKATQKSQLQELAEKHSQLENHRKPQTHHSRSNVNIKK